METTVVLPAKTSFWVEKELTKLACLFLFYMICPAIFCILAAQYPLGPERWDFYYKAQFFLFPFFAILLIYSKFQSKRHGVAYKHNIGLEHAPAWNKPFKINLVFSLVTVALIILVYSFIKDSPAVKNFLPQQPAMPWYAYLYYISFSCGVQEYLYSGIIHAEFKLRGLSDRWFILFSSLNFMFLHIFFLSFVTLALTLSVRIVWSYIFCKYHNEEGTKDLWGQFASHMIVGGVTIWLGFI